MTRAPMHPQPMSLEQWRALGEDTSTRSELHEGVLTVSPRPRNSHQRALVRLCGQLLSSAPVDLDVLPESEVLLTDDGPATIRVPDIVVTTSTSDAVLTAADVVLVIEILSPGTRHIDLVRKRADYADAGIPNYWIVELDHQQPRIEILTLDTDRYTGDWHTGTVDVREPFPATLNIDALA